jgi:hypothetical protein
MPLSRAADAIAGPILLKLVGMLLGEPTSDA